MNRFVHRLIMSALLVAALVLIWNVLAGLAVDDTGRAAGAIHDLRVNCARQRRANAPPVEARSLPSAASTLIGPPPAAER